MISFKIFEDENIICMYYQTDWSPLVYINIKNIKTSTFNEFYVMSNDIFWGLPSAYSELEISDSYKSILTKKVKALLKNRCLI